MGTPLRVPDLDDPRRHRAVLGAGANPAFLGDPLGPGWQKTNRRRVVLDSAPAGWWRPRFYYPVALESLG